jgi:hypothetical protein
MSRIFGGRGWNKKWSELSPVFKNVSSFLVGCRKSSIWSQRVWSLLCVMPGILRDGFALFIYSFFRKPQQEYPHVQYSQNRNAYRNEAADMKVWFLEQKLRQLELDVHRNNTELLIMKSHSLCGYHIWALQRSVFPSNVIEYDLFVDNCFLRWVTSVSNLVILFSLIFKSFFFWQRSL